MDAPLDLYGASRAELIARLLHEREENAELRQRLARQEAELTAQLAAIAQLTARVGTLLAASDPPDGTDPPPHPTTMRGLKPAGRTRPRATAARSWKRRTGGYGRRRMVPTARRVHAYTQCPHCATVLGGGTIKRTREVIELVPGRVEVTAHVYVERQCPTAGVAGCRSRVSLGRSLGRAGWGWECSVSSRSCGKNCGCR